MKIINALSIAALSLGLVSTSASAETQGTYTATKGFSKTLSISEKDQLGRFLIILENDQPKNKNSNKKKNRNKSNRIILGGISIGSLNDDFTLNHTFINKRRNGVLYTAGDSITQIYAGDPYCSDTVTPFEVQETLIIVAGTGKYSNVQPGSTIVVRGTINNCINSKNYGHNDFKVIGGTVTFQ